MLKHIARCLVPLSLAPCLACPAEVIERGDAGASAGGAPSDGSEGHEDGGARDGGGGAGGQGAGGGKGTGGQGGEGGGVAGPLCDPSSIGPCLVAVDQGTPWELVSDGAMLYWASGDASMPNGMVRRCATTAFCDDPPIVADGQRNPTMVTKNSDIVFWGSTGVDGYGTDGDIHFCLISEQCDAAYLLLGGTSPTALAADDTHVYWSTTGNGTGDVWRCEIWSCVPELLSGDTGMPFHMVQSESALVWSAYLPGVGTQLWACDPEQCLPRGIVPEDLLPHVDGPVAVQDGEVFFSVDDALMKCPLGGCEAEPVALTDDLGWIAALAVDDANVYLGVAPLDAPGFIARCGVEGCATLTVIAQGPDILTPYEIAIDGEQVYWSDASLGTIWRARK